VCKLMCVSVYVHVCVHVSPGSDGLVQGLRTIYSDVLHRHSTTTTNRSADKAPKFASFVAEYWRGNSVNVARIIPVLTIQAVLYQYLQQRIASPNNLTLSQYGPDGKQPKQSISKRKGALSLEAKHLLAGGIAGV
jgi:hypothetical protein